jgi:hypothetical protein
VVEVSVPERQATAFGGTVAVLIAAVAGLAVGAAHGVPGATAASLVGALAVSLGVRALQAEANARRAVGSVGLVAGTLAFAVVAEFGGVVPLLVGVAIVAAATNALVSLDEDVELPVGSAVWRSATVLAVGAIVALGASTGVFAAIGTLTLGGLAAAATTSTLALLVVLQVQLFVVLELLHWAVPILDRWLPQDRDLRAATIGRFDYRVNDPPRAYWAFFVLQLALALTGWGPRWFEAFLGSLSVLGEAIRLLFRSGVLHVPLGLVLAGLVAVLLGRGLQRVVLAWAGADPPRALASAAGGLVLLAGSAVVALPPLASLLEDVAGSPWADLFASIGPTATLSGAIAGALFAVITVASTVGHSVRPWVATDAATGFAVGAASLVVAALVASHEGASALPVFVGVAGALVVLDLGTNAVELGRQIGRLAETRRGEATHAVGGLLVGAAGVALALLTAFAMRSASFSVPAWRARLAVALLLAAVLCFVVILGRE